MERSDSGHKRSLEVDTEKDIVGIYEEFLRITLGVFYIVNKVGQVENLF